MTDKEVLVIDNIKSKIYTIRGMQVILDKDLAEFYGIETRRINEQVKRNKDRFPERYMFQLNKKENDFLRSQFATFETGKGKYPKYLPYVFTEQGVAMLSSVLKSKKAIKINILIIDAFVTMRHFLKENSNIFQKFQQIDQKFIEYDNQFEKVFNALETKKPKQGIFYNGQIFDAYKFVCDLVKSAKTSIILIDNYIDESVLELFTKADRNVKIKIYTKDVLKLDVKKYNEQYNNIELKKFNLSHDRFLIIDDKEIFHIGASLKDLGKRWFGFSKFDKESIDLIQRLNSITN
jgi:phage regulator Rha-like protein